MKHSHMRIQIQRQITATDTDPIAKAKTQVSYSPKLPPSMPCSPASIYLSEAVNARVVHCFVCFFPERDAMTLSHSFFHSFTHLQTL